MSASTWGTAVPEPVPVDPECIALEIRLKMAEHVSIKPRGFDSEGKREKLHREIDALYDRYALATATFDDLDAPLA